MLISGDIGDIGECGKIGGYTLLAIFNSVAVMRVRVSFKC